MIEIIEPGYSIAYKIASMPNEDTDYPARMIILCCSLECALDSWLPIVPCDDSGQNSWMRRLI